jgi:hypothetical protein
MIHTTTGNLPGASFTDFPMIDDSLGAAGSHLWAEATPALGRPSAGRSMIEDQSGRDAYPEKHL